MEGGMKRIWIEEDKETKWSANQTIDYLKAAVFTLTCRDLQIPAWLWGQYLVWTLNKIILYKVNCIFSVLYELIVVLYMIPHGME